MSLFVVGKALQAKSRASLLKGSAMALLGFWVIGTTVWHAMHRTLPEAQTMTLVGVLALVSNGAVLAMLWVFR